jgi:hypothetical protein
MAIFFIKMSGPGGWGTILQEEFHVKFDSIIEVGFASSPHKIFLFSFIESYVMRVKNLKKMLEKRN